jgi:hypothetical protein
MAQRIGKYYLEYRDSAIEIQENIEDWMQSFMSKTAELTEQYLRIPHGDKSSDAIEGHILEYIQRARSEVRSM